MSFWCLFLDAHLATHHSSIGVWLRQETKLGMSILHVKILSTTQNSIVGISIMKTYMEFRFGNDLGLVYTIDHGPWPPLSKFSNWLRNEWRSHYVLYKVIKNKNDWHVRTSLSWSSNYWPQPQEILNDFFLWPLVTCVNGNNLFHVSFKQLSQKWLQARLGYGFANYLAWTVCFASHKPKWGQKLRVSL